MADAVESKTELDEEEGLRLMRAFACLSTEQRTELIRAAERMSSQRDDHQWINSDPPKQDTDNTV